MSVVRVPSLLCAAEVHHHRGDALRKSGVSNRATFRHNFRPIRLGGRCEIAHCVASSDATALPVDSSDSTALEVPNAANEAEEIAKPTEAEEVKESDEADKPISLENKEADRKKTSDWNRAERFLSSKAIFDGRVEDYNDGGLVVRFYNLRGFLPYSQFSLARQPKDKKMKDISHDLVGQTLPVVVIQCDRKRGKLVFSEREALRKKHSSKFKQGAVFDGKVTGFVEYGAFVDIRVNDTYPGVGLVHLRELSWDLVKHPRDVLQIGQDVKVKIIGFDSKSSKLALSIRQLQPDPLLETLDTLMPKENDVDSKVDEKALANAPLPGIDQICEGLQKETGVTAVKLGRQAVEKHVVSQDLELWLSQEPVEDGHITLLARAGRQVQEVHVTTSLGREEMKLAIQRVTQKIP